MVTIGVVPPVVRISGTVIVRRVRGKMDKFVVVQRKQKRSSSRERDFCKRDRNDTRSCSESTSQVFSSENGIGNFAGVPMADADRRKVLFNCRYPPSDFSFPVAYEAGGWPQTLFTGHAQVAQKSWKIKNMSIHWKISGQILFFRASASCSKFWIIKIYSSVLRLFFSTASWLCEPSF